VLNTQSALFQPETLLAQVRQALGGGWQVTAS
jgi:hypothetical protein